MATWSKSWSHFLWKNKPDTSTPLGQTLLNRINEALNEIDNRVVTLNTEKASTDEIQGVFTDVRLIKNTGQFVFTLFDGTEKIIDTALEKISINVSFDKETQMMVLEKEDGSKEYVDLSVFTTQYEFVSSPTIQQTVTDGKVRADIKPNSITDQMLQTNYLADITTQANTAVSASQSALESQSLAEQYAESAKESELVVVSSVESAKESAESASASALNAKSSADKAEESETNAKVYETNASQSAESARTSASVAESSASSASNSASLSSSKASEASGYATSALKSADLATEKSESASNSAQQANVSEVTAKSYAESAQSANEEINRKLHLAEFDIDDNGNLIYTDTSAYAFTVDDDGLLNWEVA